MTIPGSLQTLGNHVFHGCINLVPANINIQPDDDVDDYEDDYEGDYEGDYEDDDVTTEVVSYLRDQQRIAAELASKLTAEATAKVTAPLLNTTAERDEEVAALKRRLAEHEGSLSDD
ncbi:hypothetical protein TL16_g04127 [Triparma laevis f. inornata]|uniref:Uncharacterized protein n=2 Tax=Triparma laevis TaxID=1534972 RepID=A0A9W7FIU6_9STRA|nr:hypothetical protein TL16_g04127 [Triparma laevis f. inornata]GMI12880.1 hypothetical protein TrLO_g3686 [Triparma laevis f. longispina]